MLDFNTTQLTWIIVSATTIGGGGYISMNEKIDNLNTKVSVTNANMDNNQKLLDNLQRQLERIEEKIDKQNLAR
jgi:uncharacterized protein HemX